MRHSTLPTSILLCLALVVPLTILGTGTAAAAELPPGGTFTDDNGSVHEPNIEAIAADGITHGCADDRFCPDEQLTRGEMAAFLQRALGLPASSTDHFRDDDGSRFEDAINALADAGITRGCESRRFCPDQSVTRGQMAAFLARAHDLPRSGRDHFRDDGRSMFEADIDAIAAARITAGCNPPDNTRFCVGEPTTRAQMATFLTRAGGLTPIDPPAPRIVPHEMSPREAIAHWFPRSEREALTVARCESSLNPRAVNHRGGWHGLFQIAEAYHRSSFERVTGVSWSDGIYTAYYNAEYAKHLHRRKGWGPWGCRP